MSLRNAAKYLATYRPSLYCAKRSMSALPKYADGSNFKYTQPPNPDWDLGQGIPEDGFNAKGWRRDLEKGWKSWKLNEMSMKYDVSLHVVDVDSHSIDYALAGMRINFSRVLSYHDPLHSLPLNPRMACQIWLQ